MVLKFLQDVSCPQNVWLHHAKVISEFGRRRKTKQKITGPENLNLKIVDTSTICHVSVRVIDDDPTGPLLAY